MWEDGVVTYLPDLGDVGGVIESFARDVNDHGTIVGTHLITFRVHSSDYTQDAVYQVPFIVS